MAEQRTSIPVPEPERFQSQAYRSVLADERWPGVARWQRAAFEAMTAALASTYPHEGCGLLLGTLKEADFCIEAVHEARNANRQRMQDRFVIDPEDYRKAEARAQAHGWEVIGVYHSHPDCPARPSPTDRDFAWHGWLYPIAAVVQGRVAEVRAWVFDEAVGKFFACEIVVA